jgi:hypothetical protein
MSLKPGKAEHGALRPSLKTASNESIHWCGKYTFCLFPGFDEAGSLVQSARRPSKAKQTKLNVGQRREGIVCAYS